jgi:hypothetical protein
MRLTECTVRGDGASLLTERCAMTPLACISIHMTVSVPRALEGRPSALNARAAGLPQRLKRCVAIWCDAQRRGTLRCAEARRVANRDVDKSYASHRRPQHGAVAR